MKRLVPFSILCLLLASAPAGAQKRAALQLLRQETKVLPETAVSNASATVRKAVLAAQITAQMQRAAVSLHAPVLLSPEITTQYKPAFSQEQIKDLPPRHKAAVLENALTPQEKELQTSVFSFRRAGDDINILSGFVVEEEFEGRKRLWGVTAAHVIDAERPYIKLTFNKDGKPFSFYGKAVRIGNPFGGGDLALIELPARASQAVVPLKLSDELPSAGENTFSYGYGRGVFLRGDQRTVLSATQHRIITEFPFDHKPRMGYCGSPLFNERGEVIGMHSGSQHKDMKTSAPWRLSLARHGHKREAHLARFSEAVPAVWIKQMLLSLHKQTNPGIALKAAGYEIGLLQPNEFIEKVTAQYGSIPMDTIIDNPFWDYERLDKDLNLTWANQIIIYINSFSDGVLSRPARVLRLDLKTGETQETRPEISQMTFNPR